VKALDRFETRLSAYIAETFTFSAVGTAHPSEALDLEMGCIGHVAACEHCQQVATPHLRPRKGVLWNSQHMGRGPLPLTEKQWAVLEA
jgi:hypothetical protein